MKRANWVALLLAIGTATAQTPELPQTFEVASIKPAAADDRMGNFPITGTLNIGNRTLRQIVMEALRLKQYQLEGGPSWVNSEHYNIVGKASFPANMGQMMKMVLPLLEERFQLKYHHETRELRQYVLTVAKGGPKMEPATAQGLSFSNTSKGIVAYRLDMRMLADILAGNLSSPVVNETNLTGEFQFKLFYNDNPKPLEPGEAATPDPGNVPITVAVQEQLGLKLEARKGPVDVVVIDHAEKPVLN